MVLNQAPTAWNKVFDEFLRPIGLYSSKVDECLYFGEINGHKAFLVVYVDDVLVVQA